MMLYGSSPFVDCAGSYINHSFWRFSNSSCSAKVRRIGVAAPLGFSALRPGKANCPIGIRPQICYAQRPGGGVGPLMRLIAKCAAGLRINSGNAVANLGSDPDSARNLQICQRYSSESGSDPNFAGQRQERQTTSSLIASHRRPIPAVSLQKARPWH